MGVAHAVTPILHKCNFYERIYPRYGKEEAGEKDANTEIESKEVGGGHEGKALLAELLTKRLGDVIAPTLLDGLTEGNECGGLLLLAVAIETVEEEVEFFEPFVPHEPAEGVVAGLDIVIAVEFAT